MARTNAAWVLKSRPVKAVEESNSDRFTRGEFVMPADGGWQKYVVADARTISRVSRRVDVPLTGHLSVLGMTGMTACFGLADVCRPQPAETLVVSAAEGAVGSVVGQIAKIKAAGWWVSWAR